MSANDEMREYLHHLLDHQDQCAVVDCATCRFALDAYEWVRSQIFSVRRYPGMADAANSPGTGADNRAMDAPGTAAARRA